MRATPIAVVVVTTILGPLAVASPATATACGAAPAGYNVIESNDPVINGTSGPDFICAGAGSNRINGQEGDDIIHGGDGEDRISAGPGNDQVFGGPAKDKISGQRGDDVLDGGDGPDNIKGGLGVDTIAGGRHDDRIFGGPGSDAIDGGSGDDEISGAGGRDTIDGGEGSDTLQGQKAPDQLHGGLGDDILRGGPGGDNLDGGEDNDALDGGNGNDRCVGGEGQASSCERMPGHLRLLSAALDGAPGNREGSRLTSASNNGRIVTFYADSTDLVPDDTNKSVDGFVYNAKNDTIERLNVTTDGSQTSGPVYYIEVSGNGSAVVFESKADDLVDNDTNGKADIFVRDLAAQTTERVSVNTAGAQGSKPSTAPTISNDGMLIMFESSSPELAIDKATATTDVFLHDRTSGVTTRVVENAHGPVLSGSGSIAVVTTDAGLTMVDLRSGRRTVIGDGMDPVLSSDGSTVLFRASKLLIPPVPKFNRTYDNDYDLYRYDVATGETTVLSTQPDGTRMKWESSGHAISPNGRFVTFFSSNQFDPDNLDTTSRLFIRDLHTGTISKITAEVVPEYFDGLSDRSIPGNDGSYVIAQAFFNTPSLYGEQIIRLDLE